MIRLHFSHVSLKFDPSSSFHRYEKHGLAEISRSFTERSSGWDHMLLHHPTLLRVSSGTSMGTNTFSLAVFRVSYH